MTRAGRQFQRRVSANEHLYLAAARVFSPLVLRLVIEGSGVLTVDALQAAVNRAAARCPGSCLRLRGGRWIADAPPPRVVLLPAHQDFRTQQHVSAVQPASLDAERGPTCEVGLVARGNDSTVVFRALHAVMDGQGVQQWARAVFACLRGDESPDLTSMLTEDEYLRRARAPIRWDEPSIPRRIGPRARSSPPAVAGQFDYACRTLHATVPAIAARLAVATRRLLCSHPDERFSAMIPVDLRRADPEARGSTANLSLPSFVAVEEADTWEQVSQKVLAGLGEKRYLKIGPKDRLYRVAPHAAISWVLWRTWLRQLRRGRYVFSTVISHVGRLDARDFRAEGFVPRSMYCLPFALPLAPLSFVITERESATEIVIVKPAVLPNTPGAMLDEVLDRAGLRGSSGEASPRREALFGLPIRADAPLDISARVNEAARTHLDRIAVSDATARLTYREFVSARDRLAAAMCVAAGRPLAGERVAVVMNRSVDAFLCVHACLELNAAFVPVDPAYPDARIRTTIDDCQPALVVRDREPVIAGGAKAVTVDDLRELAPAGASLAPAGRNASDLAYIIYTSGTTGRPKGVCVTRGSLSHYAACMEADLFAAGRQRGVALVTSLSFDASILPLVVPLLQGCEVKMVPEGLTVAALQQVIDDPDVTFCNMTPSHLQILLRLGKRPVSRWRTIVVGGETLTPDVGRRTLGLFGDDVELFNVYGPTEATVYVTSHRFDATRDTEGSVPIGHPIGCSSLYILRTDGTPCRDGEEGEMYIGGHTVAAGYWANEAATRERFVPDPFRGEGTMYRTGDRAVCRNNRIFFLGRDDDQVKINGYRVELEEVAARLKQHPRVADAAVFVDDSGAAPALAAVYRAADSARVDSGELSAFLAQAVPRFMIPQLLVQVLEIPVTAHGKVDRRLLPSHAEGQSHHAGSNAGAPDISDIWAHHLRVPKERLRADSDFFELGGDSVLLLETLDDINRLLCGGTRAAELRDGVALFYANPQLMQMVRWIESVAGRP